MNISFSITRILFCVLFFSQLAFGMEWSQQLVPSFTYFSNVQPEIQVLAMQQSDNYANVQKISKYWYKEKSIKSKDMIVNVFSFLPKEQMVDILLNAVYKKNYEGVESILQHSKILTFTDSLYHYVNVNVVLNPHGIATYKKDKKMLDLLCTYNVPKFVEGTICQPTKLMMSCLAGNSEAIGLYLNESTNNMKNALTIAVDCDRGKCLNKLINNLLWDSNIADIIHHWKQIAGLLEKSILKRACELKRIKALRELLASNKFRLNEIENGKTLLDEILKSSETNFEYNEVALLLREYGAKTAEKFAIDTADEEDIIRRLGYPGCVIS